MQISSRFTIALHIFTFIEAAGKTHKVTSELLSKSINVNPVIIRNILSQLKKHNLVSVARGSGGATINKPLNEISFLDVFNAVECIEDETLFHFHENPNVNCPIGKNIHNVLDDKLKRVQDVMQKELASITLEDINSDLKKYL